MPIEIIDLLTRACIQNNRDVYFVFGDNIAQRGRDGQAAAARGEPNTIGIPTKWYPSRSEGAYFSDGDWENPIVKDAIIQALDRIESLLKEGKIVAIPPRIGAGRGELDVRAPKILEAIMGRLSQLMREYR